MVLLGLLLMLACTALAVDAVVQNTDMLRAIAFNQPVTDLSIGALFIAGAVVGLLFALGMAMFVGGLGRASRRRRERALAEERTAEAEALRAENARLERQLADSTYPAEGSAYPADSAAYPVTPATPAGGRHRTTP